MNNTKKLIMPSIEEDKQIATGILADADTFEPDAAQLNNLRPIGRPKLENPKQAVSIRLSPQVIEFFKKDGKGWQTRLNEALEQHVATH